MPDSPLARVVAATYSPEDYPALANQIATWADARPLAGLSVLDATPVFTNTLVKYLALQAAGAEVTVSAHRAIPGDSAVIDALPDYGIAVADEAMLGTATFDIVSDCAGTHADVSSRFGFVELTRSGVGVYEGSQQPVFIADAGRIKLIETSLGTGDGFVRAMAALGHPLPAPAGTEAHGHDSSPTIVVFGGGKFGSGIVTACLARQAHVLVVDPRDLQLPEGAHLISPSDTAAVAAAIARAWCVVAATGVTTALEPWAAQLSASGALLANMGATDEFGPTIPPARALNDKVAINFALPEPTHLRYLDPTMALTNAGAVELRHGRVPAGPNLPPAHIEDALLDVVRRHGSVAAELNHLPPLSLGTPEVTA